jgi:hypothetical protein
MGIKAELTCRFCDSVIRPGDPLDADGSSHAACVEAHRDDAASSGALGPVKRFMRVWWGAGHH